MLATTTDWNVGSAHTDTHTDSSLIHLQWTSWPRLADEHSGQPRVNRTASLSMSSLCLHLMWIELLLQVRALSALDGPWFIWPAPQDKRAHDAAANWQASVTWASSRSELCATVVKICQNTHRACSRVGNCLPPPPPPLPSSSSSAPSSATAEANYTVCCPLWNGPLSLPDLKAQISKLPNCFFTGTDAARSVCPFWLTVVSQSIYVNFDAVSSAVHTLYCQPVLPRGQVLLREVYWASTHLEQITVTQCSISHGSWAYTSWWFISQLLLIRRRSCTLWCKSSLESSFESRLSITSASGIFKYEECAMSNQSQLSKFKV